MAPLFIIDTLILAALLKVYVDQEVNMYVTCFIGAVASTVATMLAVSMIPSRGIEGALFSALIPAAGICLFFALVYNAEFKRAFIAGLIFVAGHFVIAALILLPAIAQNSAETDSPTDTDPAPIAGPTTPMPSTVPEPPASIYDQLRKDYEKAEIVTVRLKGEFSKNITRILSRLRKAAGEGAVLEYNHVAHNGLVYIAPVEDIDSLVTSLNFGMIMNVDQKHRIVTIAFDSTITTVPFSTSRFEGGSTEAPFGSVRDTVPSESRPRFPADFPRPADRSAGPDAADGDFIERNVALVQDGTEAERTAALLKLVNVTPQQAASAEHRRIVAPALKAFLFERSDAMLGDRVRVVQGLVVWGGQYSAPLLVELIEQERMGLVAMECFKALEELKDPKTAEPLMKMFVNEFEYRHHAARCLKAIGPAAEETVLAQMKPAEFQLARETIEILGAIGTEKSVLKMNTYRRQRFYNIVKADIERAKDAIQARIDGGY